MPEGSERAPSFSSCKRSCRRGCRSERRSGHRRGRGEPTTCRTSKDGALLGRHRGRQGLRPGRAHTRTRRSCHQREGRRRKPRLVGNAPGRCAVSELRRGGGQAQRLPLASRGLAGGGGGAPRAGCQTQPPSRRARCGGSRRGGRWSSGKRQSGARRAGRSGRSGRGSCSGRGRRWSGRGRRWSGRGRRWSGRGRRRNGWGRSGDEH